MWAARLRNLPESGHPILSVNSKIYSIAVRRKEWPINVSVFDPAFDRWDLVHTQPLPDGRPMKIGGFSIVAYGECAYLWGGIDVDHWRPDSAVYRLDTNTMTWSRPEVTGELPTFQSCHSACLVGHCMYILPGLWSDFSEYVYFLDLEAMTWHRILTTGDVPRCLAHHTTTAIRSRMYLWGGLVSVPEHHRFEPDNSVYYLETATATWVRPNVEGVPPEGRLAPSLFVHKEKIYVLGGICWHNDWRGIHKYNPANSRWTLVKPRGSGPYDWTACRCCPIADKVFVFSEFGQRILHGEEAQIGAYRACGKEYVTHVHVLDFAPTLKTLCQVTIIEACLDVGCLPLSLRNEICAMTTARHFHRSLRTDAAFQSN